MSNSFRADPASALAVRAYRPGDEHAIQAMLATVFGRQRSLAEWSWQYREAPNGPALIYILERDGRVVGHHGRTVFPVFVDGRRLLLALGSDTMIVHEARGEGGMQRLLQGFLDSPHGCDLAMGFPTDRSAVGMERFGVGRRLGRIPRWVRWHAPHAALPQPGRLLVASRATRVYSTLVSLPRPSLRIEALEELGPDVDALAQDSAAFAPCIRIRDASYLRWRWLEQPGNRWTIAAARGSDGALRGLVVFGAARKSEHGLRGLVADVLARDATALRALLLDAVEKLTSRGCLSVACDYLDPRPWARRALYRSGFLVYGRGINTVCRALSQPSGALPEQLDAWYLTRGDTDLA
jgi:GNAT acetyltransferase-like protein